MGGFSGKPWAGEGRLGMRMSGRPFQSEGSKIPVLFLISFLSFFCLCFFPFFSFKSWPPLFLLILEVL